jgi:hypothetical protein
MAAAEVVVEDVEYVAELVVSYVELYSTRTRFEYHVYPRVGDAEADCAQTFGLVL